jgi:lipoyl(octanoyl) transferase
MRTLRVHRLGRLAYADGLELMRRAGDLVARGSPPGTDHLFVVEHPPTVTLGRGADSRNVVASPEWLRRRGFEVHETDRGGDVTYHGPGQTVLYPVLDLSGWSDVHRYVWTLEEAMIRTCAVFGVAAGRDATHRGAWVMKRKIGAVGIRLMRWITSHGCAFNVAPDLDHFRAIVPCGIRDPELGVTSLAVERMARDRIAPRAHEVEEHLIRILVDLLERRRQDAGPGQGLDEEIPVDLDGRLVLLSGASRFRRGHDCSRKPGVAAPSQQGLTQN